MNDGKLYQILLSEQQEIESGKRERFYFIAKAVFLHDLENGNKLYSVDHRPMEFDNDLLRIDGKARLVDGSYLDKVSSLTNTTHNG